MFEKSDIHKHRHINNTTMDMNVQHVRTRSMQKIAEATSIQVIQRQVHQSKVYRIEEAYLYNYLMEI